MSDIVVEANNVIDFCVNWNLEVFQGSILLPQALKYNIDWKQSENNLSNYYFHQFLVLNVNPLALPDKILLLITIILDFARNLLSLEVSKNCLVLARIHNSRQCQI